MGANVQARLDRIETLLTTFIADSADKVYGVDGAAEYLEVSPSHVYHLAGAGKLAHFKPNGKKLYFLKRDLDAYIRRNRRASAEEVATAAVDGRLRVSAS